MENRVDIHETRGSGEAAGTATLGRGLLNEVIALNLETAAAGCGDGAKLGLDPVRGGEDSLAGREIGGHAGEGAARAEADELGDVGPHVIGRDSPEGGGDGWVGGGRGQMIGGGRLGLPGSRQYEADRGGSKCKKALHSSVSELTASNRRTNCRRPMLTSQRRAVRTSEAAHDAF